MHKISHVIKRQGNQVPYDRDRITTAIFRALVSTGDNDRQLADQLSLQVEQILLAGYTGTAVPTIEDIQDIVEKVLFEEGHSETAHAYMEYRQKRAQARATRAYSFEVTDNIPYKKIYDTLCWNMAHNCDSIAGLNQLIAGGGFANLIEKSNLRYDTEIRQAAELILSRIKDIRLVIVAGPSSSGKTTTTTKLGEWLSEAGLELQTLNIDNYFFNREDNPRDEFGDYDYESPQALDLNLINEHLSLLLAGRSIEMPFYDFKAGIRHLNTTPLTLKPNQLILLDSLHGLYDGMTSAVPDICKFRLYIETLDQLRTEDGQFMRWADHRLLRRMIRDSWHRNSQPEATITHWRYVRRSELQHIIPFIGTADFLVNSALPYELPFLKYRLFDYLPAAIRAYQADSARQDAYIRAKRIYEFLEPLTALADDSDVPANSLLREFIGGSCYEY